MAISGQQQAKKDEKDTGRETERERESISPILTGGTVEHTVTENRSQSILTGIKVKTFAVGGVIQGYYAVVRTLLVPFQASWCGIWLVGCRHSHADFLQMAVVELQSVDWSIKNSV